MKRKSLLILVFVLTFVSLGSIKAKEVNNTTILFPGSLMLEQEITVKGVWNNEGLAKLNEALHIPIIGNNVKLAKIDLSGVTFAELNDASINLNGLLKYSSALTEVILPKQWGITLKTDFSGMFEGCPKLETIVNLDTYEKITSLESTFDGCHSLINLSFADEQKVKSDVNFHRAFAGCKNLVSIANLDKFEWIGNLSSVFANCSSLERVSFTDELKSESEVSLSRAFSGCGSLVEIENLNVFNRINSLTEAFNNCTQLGKVVFASDQFLEVAIDLTRTFSDCENLLFIENLDKFTQISNVLFAFENCKLLTYVQLASLPSDILKRVGAFNNINPNCLKYVPFAEADWILYTNFILNGDNGYQSNENVYLHDDYPYFCPIEFAVKKNRFISYERTFQHTNADNINWTTICLPFAPTSIMEGHETKYNYIFGDFTDIDINEDANKVIFTRISELDADKPHLIAFFGDESESSKITFSRWSTDASPEIIPASTFEPEDWHADGEYRFTGSYRDIHHDEEHTYYVLNEGHNKFVRNLQQKIEPFHGFMDANNCQYDELIIDEGLPTNIEKVLSDKDFFVYGKDGQLVIVTSVEERVDIYSLNGQLIKKADIQVGINRVDGLPKGIYIIKGRKVIL